MRKITMTLMKGMVFKQGMGTKVVRMVLEHEIQGYKINRLVFMVSPNKILNRFTADHLGLAENTRGKYKFKAGR